MRTPLAAAIAENAGYLEHCAKPESRNGLSGRGLETFEFHVAKLEAIRDGLALLDRARVAAK